MGGKKEERKCACNYCGCQKEANQMALGTAGLCSAQLEKGGENVFWQWGENIGRRKWGQWREGCGAAKGTSLSRFEKTTCNLLYREKKGKAAQDGHKMRGISPGGYAEKAGPGGRQCHASGHVSSFSCLTAYVISIYTHMHHSYKPSSISCRMLR